MNCDAEQVITPFLRAAADLNQTPRILCCCLFQASHQPACTMMAMPATTHLTTRALRSCQLGQHQSSSAMWVTLGSHRPWRLSSF